MNIRNIAVLLCLVITLIFAANDADANDDSHKDKEGVNTLLVHFEPNQMLQLIAPLTDISKNNEEGVKLRNQYYQTAIPLAQQYGFKNLGQLIVTETIVGDFRPGAYVIGSWPSLKTFDEFANLPEWATLKALRVEAWDELKLFNAEIKAPLSLSFREDKFYTVVFAWNNPQHPNNYSAYLEGIEPALNRVGGRFMLKIKQPTMESHDSNAVPPNQITFVEWNTKNGFATLQQQEGYKRFIALRDSGLQKIEFHRLAPRIPERS